MNMQRFSPHFRGHIAPGLLSLCVVLLLALFPQRLTADSTYSQVNLVSNVPGVAANTDPNLKNPWGLASSATSPFWVSDQGTGLATIYNGSGTILPLVVTIPANGNGPNGPTGVVFSAGQGFTGSPFFIFSTLAGTIATWNGGTSATIAAFIPGAVFTGLAEANNGLGSFLYAADFAGGTIHVFDSTFTPTTLSGSFTDPSLPTHYNPYNIQNVGGKLYVEYAPVGQSGAVPGLGNGFIDVFDLNGNFLERLVSRGPLDDPWGIAQAPVGFGTFSGDLLVGNFGNGEINAFNPATGAFLGTLDNSQGQPIVNDGLWGLRFGNGAAGGNTNTLFFNAGINGQADGLFGSIIATPEPATVVLLGTGLIGLISCRRRRKLMSWETRSHQLAQGE